MAPLIEPRTLKGFRDYAPALMIPRERVLQTAREVYRSFGFAPMDTPALEYAEVLLGKGGDESDKLVYRFRDHGDRDVALRFDLTVPFARFAAQHVAQLGTPFKRYAMGPVWRGENTAAGRYREFWQCDFDTIGTTSNAADAEVVLVVYALFNALKSEELVSPTDRPPDIEIHINNRLVLNGLLESIGVLDKSIPLLRALDKIQKIGAEKVTEEMVREASITEQQATQILSLVGVEGSNDDKLERVERLCGNSATATEGVARLREVLALAKAGGVPESAVQIDLSIARGLDYYTGFIFETFLTNVVLYGSVCSGGRYDNLAGLYTKQVLPGVGGSLGVDRLLTAMEGSKHSWFAGTATPAPVLVVRFNDVPLPHYIQVAAALRSAGIGCELYPEAVKLLKQLQYADKRGFQLAVLVGGDEYRNGNVQIKHLPLRSNKTVPLEQVGKHASDMLKWAAS